MKHFMWNEIISMYIPQEPDRTTDQQKGECIKHRILNGRRVPYIHHFTKPEVEIYHKKLAYHLLRYRPDEPITGPVAIYITFCFKARRKKDIGEPKVTKPDLDNMAKGILDVLTKLRFWEDDNQICEMKLVKLWTSEDHVGTFINLYYDQAREEEEKK